MTIVSQTRTITFVLMTALLAFGGLRGQSADFLMPYYFDTGPNHYILDKGYVQDEDPDITLFSYLADGDIVFLDSDSLVAFVADAAWHRIVYGRYGHWVKAFGSWGSGTGNLSYPDAIVADGWEIYLSLITQIKGLLK